MKLLSQINHANSNKNVSMLIRILPKCCRPFAILARIDKPIGTWLLLWPCFWSICLAEKGLPDARLLALFATGALVMRSAGCVLNDIIDSDLDARVERTAHRPLASGIISKKAALVFLILLLALGLLILAQLNTFAIYVGLGSIVLIIIYPFMKRITHWPQLILGLTFNWGALLGWAAVQSTLGWSSGMLYLAGIAWTLGYDTIYAHQDKKDDLKVGIKSSAIYLGERTKPYLTIFYCTAVLCLIISGYIIKVSWPFYIGVIFAAIILAVQLTQLRLSDPANCLHKFKLNFWVGFFIFAGILGSRIIDTQL